VILSLLTFLLIHSANVEAKTIQCWASPFDPTPLLNAPVMMEQKDDSNKQFLVYETLRADCENGYVVDLEGYGFWIYGAELETFWISCPWVQDFHGTYFGPKINLGLGFGGDASTFIGPGVCFVGGIQLNGYGVGVALAALKIMHKHDAPQHKIQKEEIPEERKVAEWFFH
jgi:hypothetical protein